MRFQLYLNESRTVGIDLKKVKKIWRKFEDSIMHHRKTGKSMVRFSATYGDKEYMLLDPKKSRPRKSANTANYYTLVIDNSSKWRRFPKRSYGILCNYDSYIPYDDFVVFPKNGSKIAQCPSFDMWDSFQSSGIENLHDYNQLIKALLSNVRGETKDNNITEFKKACKDFDEWYKSIMIEREKYGINKSVIPDRYKSDGSVTFYYSKIFKSHYHGDLYKMIENLLDPFDNGFRLVDTKRMNILSSGLETWTSDESLLIKPFNRSLDYFYKEIGLEDSMDTMSSTDAMKIAKELGINPKDLRL